jgi:EmrB/QacA subfamily drug resistance transporter
VTAAAPHPDTASTGSPLSHKEILGVLGGLMTAMLLAALDQTIVSTALPTIVGELGGLTHLSWVVTAYLLASTVSVPLYGKVSDMYGRKNLFQFAIVLFVLGSIASGAAQSMGQLIAFRAVQGAGAGGLMALSMTIIGDVVAPRERGRYMGYIGSVFGLSSVIGPLLGGYFVDNLTWRWIFYVNVPLGLIALVVTQRNLRLSFPRRTHRIDWLGAALLTAGVSALLLAMVWGGDTYAWSSPIIVGLVAGSIATLVLFVVVEQRAEEPILPLTLFSGSVFAVSSVISFITGLAMFGSIIFLPLFLQVVLGVSATNSGLLLLPLVLGMLTGMIGSGRMISRTGRYRVYPIVGMALLAVGLFLLSTMGLGTQFPVACAYMAITGLGIGLTMQVLVLAVQNSVAPRHLGTATSAMQFFRSIGGTVGVTLFGALMTARLTANLTAAGAPGLAESTRGMSTTPAAIAQLPPQVREVLQLALADAVTFVFIVAVPAVVVAFFLAWAVKEVPLRTTVGVGAAMAEGAPGVDLPAEGVDALVPTPPRGVS